jgi:hypothetical protein
MGFFDIFRSTQRICCSCNKKMKYAETAFAGYVKIENEFSDDYVERMCSSCNALVCSGCVNYGHIEKKCPLCGGGLITVTDYDLDSMSYPR